MVVLQQELVLRKKNTHIWCIFRGTSTNVGKNGISRPHQLQFILQWISHIDVNPTRSWTKSWDSCRCVCVSIVVHTCGKMRLFGCVHRVQIPYFVWQSSKKNFPPYCHFYASKDTTTTTTVCSCTLPFERKNPKKQRRIRILYPISSFCCMYSVCNSSSQGREQQAARRRVLRRVSHKKAPTKHIFFPAFSASSSRVPASLATEMSKIGLPEDDRGAGLFLAMPASFLVRSK